MMNEDKLMAFLNNLDDDLIEKEVDQLLEGVEVDMNAIKEKSLNKLNGQKKKSKRRKVPYVVAACLFVLSISMVYADDISKAIEAFFDKTSVYSTVVDGDAYYLSEAYPLNEDIQIESLMVSEGELDMSITSNLSHDQLGEINIIPLNDPDTVYFPGGYGASEDEKEYFFSFMNKTENNYNIKPFKDFQLIIAGKTFDVSLDEGKKFDSKDEIYTSEAIPVKGVDLGVTKFEKDGKLNIQIIPAFEDKDLKLRRLGMPESLKVSSTTENRENGIFTSGGSRTKEIYVWDQEGNKYKLEIPKDAKARPITTFETDAPKDKELTLQLPALTASYRKVIDEFSLEIPKDGEIALNKALDLNIKQAVLKKITRTSPTSAEIAVDLNTEGDKNILIRSLDFYSEDVDKIVEEYEGDKGTIRLEFNKDIDKINVTIGYPDFLINGNWSIPME